MKSLEEIFGRYGFAPFILRSEDHGVLVDFDSGIDFPAECLDEIRAAFPGKRIRICGFIDDTGFRIKIG